MSGSVATARADLLGIVRETLAAVIDTDPARITADSALERDLGVDSIGRIHLADLLELRLAPAGGAPAPAGGTPPPAAARLRIEDDDLAAFRSVGDVVTFLAARL